MTISYPMGFAPVWYQADLTGLPLAGGYLASFSSLNHTQFKAIYQDDAGVDPFPYVAIPNVGKTGILFDENGQQGPFFFLFDSTNPSDLYYLELYDHNGVLQWTVDDYIPGTGGGGSVTNDVNLQNMVINNVFYRSVINLGSSSSPPTVSPGTMYLVAPGANSGLVLTSSKFGPDIYFIKSDTSATDTISLPAFALGSNPLGSDITPTNYLNYSCSVAGTESYKYVQFPITQGVENLSNTQVTVTIWARANSGVSTGLTLQFAQFFGDGTGASATQYTGIGTFTLTSSWQQFKATVTISSITGKSLGNSLAVQTGNDGLFLQISYPLDEICSIDFVKPSVYLGALSPVSDFQTNDMIDGFMDTPRTGDIVSSLRSNLPGGWVQMDDGTIGTYNSGATTRGAVDTFALFSLLWPLNSTYIPMYTSGGALQARGATAIADFVAGYAISLPKTLGQVLAGSNQTNLFPASTFTTAGGAGSSTLTIATGLTSAGYGTGTPVSLTTSGSLPTGLSTSIVYYSVFLTS